MFCRRETYKVLPEKMKECFEYVTEHLFPNQIKHGASLIGCWETESKQELIVLWEYDSYEEYLQIEMLVKQDKMFQSAMEHIDNKGRPYLDVKEDFLASAGAHQIQKHTVSVSGYITNDEGEVLLVKTYWRGDTWELPGGGVDEGETLDVALRREILEETGIHVKLNGVTGVYSNGRTISIVFCGKSVGGKLQTSEETQAVRFVNLNSSNVLKYIKRGKFIPRVVDAMNLQCIPYEAFKVRPYELLERIDGGVVKKETEI